jgi:hypothetical protein
MTSTAQTVAIAPPTLAQEMRDSVLLFGMFFLPISLLGLAIGAVAALQALAS